MEKYKKILSAVFKYIFTSIITFLILGLFIENRLFNIFIVSFIITLFNYFGGTLFIYKLLNARISSIIIGILDVFIVYLIVIVMDEFSIKIALIILYAFLNMIFEYYYNKYIYTHLA